MRELDEFLSVTLGRLIEAEVALHNGDPAPRFSMWSKMEPITVFGAFGPCNSGWDEISRTFEWVASRFSANTAYQFDLMTAGVGGDLAYTVGFERFTTSIDGRPATPMALRVTQLYRREDAEWKIVHRHADTLNPDQPTPTAPAAASAGPTPEDAAPPDLAGFLASALPRQVESESAWHQRDLDARLNQWSTREPVTLFGGGGACLVGSGEVRRNFRTVVAGIIPCRSFRYDLAAAGCGGALAYTAGFERVSFAPGDADDYSLRVTYVYRRERGEWKTVHRHADYLRP